jgi:hypothetical protein
MPKRASYQAYSPITLMAAFLAVLSFSSCYYDKEELLYPGSNQPVDCTTVAAKFSADISPIMSGKCATSGCHDVTAAGGVILQTYAQISAAKDRINVRCVVQKSMPPSGPLPLSDINKLKCWIDAGAPNN